MQVWFAVFFMQAAQLPNQAYNDCEHAVAL